MQNTTANSSSRSQAPSATAATKANLTGTYALSNPSRKSATLEPKKVAKGEAPNGTKTTPSHRATTKVPNSKSTVATADVEKKKNVTKSVHSADKEERTKTEPRGVSELRREHKNEKNVSRIQKSDVEKKQQREAGGVKTTARGSLIQKKEETAHALEALASK